MNILFQTDHCSMYLETFCPGSVHWAVTSKLTIIVHMVKMISIWSFDRHWPQLCPGPAGSKNPDKCWSLDMVWFWSWYPYLNRHSWFIFFCEIDISSNKIGLCVLGGVLGTAIGPEWRAQFTSPGHISA